MSQSVASTQHRADAVEASVNADLANGDNYKRIEGILIGEDEDGLCVRASGKLAFDPLPPMDF